MTQLMLGYLMVSTYLMQRPLRSSVTDQLKKVPEGLNAGDWDEALEAALEQERARFEAIKEKYAELGRVFQVRRLAGLACCW